MKALITGAGGFVGPHLRRALEAAGDDVTGLDLRNGPNLLDGPGWTAVVAEHRPDVIYHLAGWSDVSGSWRDPAATFQVNGVGTLSVLDAARAAGTDRVVLVSSADVYGTVSPDVLPLTEEHPMQPRSPYGASKQAAEALGMQYHRAHGLGVIIVRPFNHLGTGQSPRFAAPAFAAQIAEAEQVGHGTVAHGDLSAERDLTDVRDVVEAYRLLAAEGRPGEVYNVCSGRAVSMQSMLDRLIAGATVPIATAIDPDRLRPVELPVLRGSHRKLSEATGWEPRHSLDDTLDAVLTDARGRVAV
ncbi:MAG: GDP-mannose 4,6-dehydratase [Actinomycetota bacterium]